MLRGSWEVSTLTHQENVSPAPAWPLSAQHLTKNSLLKMNEFSIDYVMWSSVTVYSARGFRRHQDRYLLWVGGTCLLSTQAGILHTDGHPSQWEDFLSTAPPEALCVNPRWRGERTLFLPGCHIVLIFFCLLPKVLVKMKLLSAIELRCFFVVRLFLSSCFEIQTPTPIKPSPRYMEQQQQQQ